jgi:hypothetical protein
MSSIEQIRKIYPDFKPVEYCADDPEWSPDDEYDEDPRSEVPSDCNEDDDDKTKMGKTEAPTNINATPEPLCEKGENCEDVFQCRLAHTPAEYKEAHSRQLSFALQQQKQLWKSKRRSAKATSSSSVKSQPLHSMNYVDDTWSAYPTNNWENEDLFNFVDSRVCDNMYKFSACAVPNCDMNHGKSNPDPTVSSCKQYLKKDICARLWGERGCRFHHGKRTHKKTAKMMLGKARIRDDPLVKLEIRLVEG